MHPVMTEDTCNLRCMQVVMTVNVLTSRLPRYIEKLFSVSKDYNYNLGSNQTKLMLPKPKKNFSKEVSGIELSILLFKGQLYN